MPAAELGRRAAVPRTAATVPRPASGRPAETSRVSPTSALRFARRVRARRWRRVLTVAAGAALGGLVVWVALASPWLRVRVIEVSGTQRVPAGEVQRVTAEELGRPLLLSRTADVRRRVSELRLVRTATVSRVWPSTLRVTVTERQPVAAVPSPGGYDLVDAEGVVLEALTDPAPGLPLVAVDVERAGAATLGAAVRVWTALPDSVRGDVRSLGASTPDAVWLKLRNGTRVRWGDDEDVAGKAAALVALRRAEPTARVYDVSAPGAPAVVD